METTKRGRPKALCYEDILMMLVRHPVTGLPVLAMAIKFIHHKGADKKPRPYGSNLLAPSSGKLTDASQDHFFLHSKQEVNLLPHYSHSCPCVA